MSRFAFLPTPLPGHVNPTLAVARELVRGGAEVAYYLPESFRAGVESAGATLRPVRVPAPGRRDGAGAGRRDGAGAGRRDGAGADPLARLVLAPVAMTRASLSVLPQVLEPLRADAPDVVVYDALSVWGRVAAQRLSRRAAMLWASYAMNRHFSYLLDSPPEGELAGALRAALDQFGADMDVLSRTYEVRRLGLTELFLHSEPLTIVCVPRALQPAAHTFGERYVFVGPSVRTVQEPLDPELASFAAGGALAYASLGTVFNDWPEFYPLCAGALSEAGFRVLLSGTDAGLGAAASPTVLVRQRVPQLAILERAAVFVTHGGMNSTMEALAAGVPMVVVPQMPEQALTAERVVAAGAGLCLRRNELTVAGLRAAAREVAENPAYRKGARELWRAVADDAGGAAAAAGALNRYAVTPVERDTAAATPATADPTAAGPALVNGHPAQAV